MGEKIMYALLRGWVMLHAYLPMRCLYFLSDLLYVLVYSVVRYRVKVTRRNMAASFPELTEKERRALECRFYRHFTDYIVETIKLGAISHGAEDLRAAYSQAFDVAFTDDASVAMAKGIPLSFCEGERYNFKLTTPEDLALAEMIVSCQDRAVR